MRAGVPCGSGGPWVLVVRVPGGRHHWCRSSSRCRTCLLILMSNRMVGGTSEAKPPNDDVQQLLLSIKDKVEEKLGRSVSQFKLLSYKTQVVAGRNYFAKIDIGEDEVLHVRVYQDLQQKVSLHSLQHPKNLHDDITYF